MLNCEQVWGANDMTRWGNRPTPQLVDNPVIKVPGVYPIMNNFLIYYIINWVNYVATPL